MWSTWSMTHQCDTAHVRTVAVLYHDAGGLLGRGEMEVAQYHNVFGGWPASCCRQRMLATIWAFTAGQTSASGSITTITLIDSLFPLDDNNPLNYPALPPQPGKTRASSFSQLDYSWSRESWNERARCHIQQVWIQKLQKLQWMFGGNRDLQR